MGWRLVILSLILLATPLGASPKTALQWVQAIGVCDNTSEIATHVFGGPDVDESWLTAASWRIEDLPGGMRALTVIGDQGNGMSKMVTASLYEVVEGRCRLVHEGGDTEFLTNEPLLNGRPMLDESWSRLDDDGLRFTTVRFFWLGYRYQRAFFEKRLALGDDEEVFEGRVWDPTNRHAYHRAYRRARDIKAELTSIFALDAQTAWVAGEYRRDHLYAAGPALFATTDGGTTWREIGIEIVPELAISSLFFLNRDLGWAAVIGSAETACGPAVLRTDDGGASWQVSEIDLPIPPAPSICFAPTSIEFVTPDVGILTTAHTIVADEEAVFVTTDRGETWSYSHGREDVGGSGQRLSRAPDATLWKLGDFCEQCDSNAVSVSSDGGLNWRPVIPPLESGSRPDPG